MKLYHYVHCPFCVRVRMALGFLNIPYESVVLPYNDEDTPVELKGVKMLPIFEWEKGDVNNESLDIIKRLDIDNKLNMQLATESEKLNEVNSLLGELGAQVHSLCMPYWMWTPEFNQESREYFQKKKEIKRGPFNKLVQNKKQFIFDLEDILDELEGSLEPFYKSKEMTILDIMIASHIWGMYIFPEFQFSIEMNNYLQIVKEKCRFEYHEDFWR